MLHDGKALCKVLGGTLVREQSASPASQGASFAAVAP